MAPEAVVQRQSRNEAVTDNGAPMSVLSALTEAIRDGSIDVIDLTAPLSDTDPGDQAAGAVRQYGHLRAARDQPV